ncbi:NAD-dependent epimerase/dehydratase family protein [Candidatus Woesearchaeota archaeon]|nr:NAD-dependent epimerase/dehydratase family protein [Candidatus Woesearchaeota archaeon]
MTNILVTGVAGFIGSHVAKALLQRGDSVIGVDNLNEYYDVNLKKARLDHFFVNEKNFKFYKQDFTDLEGMDGIFSKNQVDKICHLGAQAGVRHSIENPFTYLKNNIDGTAVIFEMAKKHKVRTVVYASSSSVYGGNKEMPFSVKHNVDNPVSLYAATKKSNELKAYVYHHLFGINMTGLRFFTVYGPWGRPDMALFLFTKAILDGKPIDVYNFGNMKRDFTFVDDIADGVLKSLDKEYPYEIFNLGNSKTVELNYFISCIENKLGKKAEKNLLPIQPGDVPESFADISCSAEKLGFSPKVGIEEGIDRFVEWYKEYHNVT